MQDFHSIKSPITLAFGQENLQQKVLFIDLSLSPSATWLVFPR